MVVEKSDTPPITVLLHYERRFALSYGAGEQSLAKKRLWAHGARDSVLRSEELTA